MAEEKRVIDWEAIEIQYRAGVRSLLSIAKEYGVTDAGIIKRARKMEWTRDLRARIQAKADAKVSASLVSDEVRTRTKIAESQIIEIEAHTQATIRISERKDIIRARALAMKLLAELEEETDNVELFKELGVLMRSEDKNGIDRLNDLYQKVISNSGRIDSMKKAAETIKTLIGLEREAYGIKTEVETPVDGISAIIAQINGTTLRIK